jgi:hypothetical protein
LPDGGQDREVRCWPDGVEDCCGGVGAHGEQRRLLGGHTVLSERDDELKHLGGCGVQDQLVREA